jgi:hypothetical protein
MKKFLLKILIYIILSIISIVLGLYYKGYLEENEYFSFVSNSISFNAKSKFIANHQNQLINADYLIVGSSMSLNNINGSEFENQTKKSAINLSSWGLKLSDVKEFSQFFKINTPIIMNISFTDFGKSEIKKYWGSPISNKFEMINKFLDLKTFISHKKEIILFTSKSANLKYQNLNFDKTGSVLLMKDNFIITPNRWEGSPRKSSDEDITMFTDELKIFNKVNVFIFFSPERKKYKNKEKIVAIKKIQDIITHKYKNITFINNYLKDFDDSLFVDCTHLNNVGAMQYTKLICDEIKLKSIKQ